MKNIFSFIVGSLLLTALYSCGEELMKKNKNTEMPVVESYLQEGTNSLSVKIYSMELYFVDDIEVSKPIEGLSVYINEKELTETSSGTYSLDLENDTIRENQEYNLRFDYNGKTIEALSTIPEPVKNLRVEPETLTIYSSWYFWDTSDETEVIVSWDNPDDSYYQVYIESPNITDTPSLGIFGRRTMQPFKGNTYRMTMRDFRSTGAHWIYIYRVNKDYVDLFERISSSDLANPVSSIQNAFGIFTSMSVARVRVDVYESS